LSTAARFLADEARRARPIALGFRRAPGDCPYMVGGAASRPVRDDNKMPGQYWAYGFWMLIGAPLLIAMGWIMTHQVRWLAALADLPAVAAGAPRDTRGGAAFHGRLQGAPLRTPLGQPAVAWIGVVTVTARRGKSSATSEVCRIGSLDGLQLTSDAGSAPLTLPALTAIDPKLSFPNGSSRRPRGWMGPATTVAPIPEAIVQRCQLDRTALAKNEWKYSERRIEAGTAVGFAGCGGPDGIAPCASGVAIGHLSVGGTRALIRRLADDTIGTAMVMVVVTSFFTMIGGGGAALALRRSANRRRVRL
jgi:hypothetical protein